MKTFCNLLRVQCPKIYNRKHISSPKQKISQNSLYSVGGERRNAGVYSIWCYMQPCGSTKWKYRFWKKILVQWRRHYRHPCHCCCCHLNCYWLMLVMPWTLVVITRPKWNWLEVVCAPNCMCAKALVTEFHCLMTSVVWRYQNSEQKRTNDTFLPWRWRQQVYLKCWYPSTKVCSVTLQKIKCHVEYMRLSCSFLYICWSNTSCFLTLCV